MYTLFRLRRVSVLASVVFAILSLPAHAAGIKLPGPLVDAQWLHAHLDDVTIIDVREDPKTFTTPPRYTTLKNGERRLTAVGGHIPGSHLVRFADIRVPQDIKGQQINFMRPSAYAFQSVMQDSGLSADLPIIVVSPSDINGALENGTASIDTAARLYWTLKTFGAKDVALLNGGVAGWLQAGYPVDTSKPDLMPGGWTAQKPDLQWSADTADVISAKKDGYQVIDARPIRQFLGIDKAGIVPKYGHIPHATSLPTDATTRQDGIAAYYLTKAGYEKVLPQLGIDTGKPTITYCNTGHFAAGAWFVMHEIIGNANTRLYDGSMLEWAKEGHPVEPADGTAAH